MPKFIVIKRYKYETPDGWEYSEEVTYHDSYDDADVSYINHKYNAGNKLFYEEKMICVPIERENNNA